MTTTTTTAPGAEAAATEAGERPRVLIAEKIAQAGIDSIAEQCDVEVADGWDLDTLTSRIGEFDAIVIRSATKMTPELIEAGTNLRVIGRAGVGVDNVDLDAASTRGIVVVNAPTSNVLSVAEHTLGILLALARNVTRGDSTLRQGEWQRSKLKGVELAGRTLVLLGAGRIGQLVAARARAFGMRVVGYDPFLPAERFVRIDVERAETIEEALGQADVISLHMPLTPDTRGMVDDALLASVKPGALLVNTARGALCDLDALQRALDAGTLGGAALDVFPEEPPPAHPLFERSDVVLTPHLAASTVEAQDRAGTQVADQVVAALCGGVVTSAVNVPAIGPEELEVLQPWMPLASRLARLADQLVAGPPSSLHVNSRGELASFGTRMLVTGALVGLLAGSTDEPVNAVNAVHVAERRGLDVTEAAEDAATTYRSVLSVRVGGNDRIAKASGTLIGGPGPAARPWLTRLVGFDLDIELTRHMAFFRYRDVPGVIGHVGTAFGDAGINIANMSVARRDGLALMAVSFDEAPPQRAIDRIAAAVECEIAHAVDLG
ncbi:MAG: phosphoglycerate dehydrogenase [Thermoleophilia bacterium]|nr:phosphoglycerate dehydrogenase [Thermoleophilia bacterium]